MLIIINQIKIEYTGEPIFLSDVNFIFKIKNLYNMVSGNLMIIMIKYCFIFITVAIILFIVIKWIKNNERLLTNFKNRIIMILTCVILLVILFAPNKYTRNIYLKLFLGINEYKDYNSYTTNLSYYGYHTLLSGMYGVMLNNRFEEPQDYNEEELNNMLKEVNNKKIADSWGKPNIILLFSESFWDIDKQSDVKFNKEVAPNIKVLKEEGKLIETISCAYGGMSENVAFELLTGGSLNYFNKGYIPVMSLYKRKNSENIPSIVKELKANKYKSKIVFGEDCYNSEEALKKIGFDEYVDLKETEDNIKGHYISDEYITNTIIEELENKNENEKIFYMAETIQNHMPYDNEKYYEYDINIKKSNLEDEMNEIITSYAQGVYDADKQLNRLYEYIKNYDEPTILVFLGDHLPYLYTKNGKNVIESLSYFNTENEIEKIYRKYNTQALILSNYSIETNRIQNHLSNNLLLTYIVNQLDINLSSYYKWLYSTTEYLPASNLYVSVDINGKKYNTKELEGDMKKMYQIRECMQYKFFINTTE